MNSANSQGATLPSSGFFKRAWLARRDLSEVGILVGLVILFSILNPVAFPTVKNLTTILNTAAVPIILGVGATFVVLMGRIDLSIEGVMGAAGMTFVLLAPNSRTDFHFGLLAIVAGIGVGVLLGLITGLLHTRLRIPSFIVSLGMWYVGLGIASVLFGQEMIPFLTVDWATKWPTSHPLGVPNSFLLALGVTIVGVLIERYTRLGRLPFAIGNNEVVARMTGIPVRRYCLYLFALAGGCSAIAGILASLSLGAGAADVGGGMLFLTLAAVVIGGTPLSGGHGGVLRTLVGVLILTTLYNGLIVSGVDPSLQSGVSGIVLIAALMAAGWWHRDRLRIVK